MPKSKSRKKKPPKRVLALADLEQAKPAVLKQPDVRHRPTDLRPGHSPVRHLVRFGASPRVHRTVVLRYRTHLEQKVCAEQDVEIRSAKPRLVEPSPERSNKSDHGHGKSRLWN